MNNRKMTRARRSDEYRNQYVGTPKNEADVFIEKRCIEADTSVKAMLIHMENNPNNAEYYKQKADRWKDELKHWLEIASETLSKHRLKLLNKKLIHA